MNNNLKKNLLFIAWIVAFVSIILIYNNTKIQRIEELEVAPTFEEKCYGGLSIQWSYYSWLTEAYTWEYTFEEKIAACVKFHEILNSRIWDLRLELEAAITESSWINKVIADSTKIFNETYSLDFIKPNL